MGTVETIKETISDIDFELPDGDDVAETFGGLIKRWSKAVEAWKVGRGPLEKISFFFTAFFSEVEELEKIEDQVEAMTSEKTAELLFQQKDEDLVAAVEKSVLGAGASEDDKKLVNEFATIGLGAARKAGTKDTNMAIASFEKAGKGEKVPLVARLTTFSFGLNTLAEVKKHPSFDTPAEFKAALDKFAEFKKAGGVAGATGEVGTAGEAVDAETGTAQKETGDAGTGAEAFKGAEKLFPAVMDPAKLGKLFSLTKDELTAPSLSKLRDKIDADMLPNIIGDAITYPELNDKFLEAKTLSDTDAMRLQKAFARLLPNTSEANRAKFLQEMNKLINAPAGQTPDTQQVTDLVFMLDTRDIESLAETLHP